ncbi:MAG: GerMN domain-containing protein [Holophagae bacterium]|jgi:germination protein M
MSRRVVWIVIAALVIGAVLAWLLVGGGRRVVAPDSGTLEVQPTPTPAPEQRVVLLFLGADGLLHPELRSVPLPSEIDERIRVVVTEMLAGPTGDLHPVVPWAAQLNAVFVDLYGTAFIDLTAPPEPLTGSHTELILAYGLVDSILLNCPELGAVQILFSGHEVPTLTGHLDLSRPLVLNKRFIGS